MTQIKRVFYGDYWRAQLTITDGIIPVRVTPDQTIYEFWGIEILVSVLKKNTPKNIPFVRGQTAYCGCQLDTALAKLYRYVGQQEIPSKIDDFFFEVMTAYKQSAQNAAKKFPHIIDPTGMVCDCCLNNPCRCAPDWNAGDAAGAHDGGGNA